MLERVVLGVAALLVSSCDAQDGPADAAHVLVSFGSVNSPGPFMTRPPAAVEIELSGEPAGMARRATLALDPAAFNQTVSHMFNDVAAGVDLKLALIVVRAAGARVTHEESIQAELGHTQRISVQFVGSSDTFLVARSRQPN